MEYIYELRDRVLNSARNVTDEMLEVLSSHVFTEAGRGPIEQGFGITYIMPESLVDEFLKLDENRIEWFRKRMLQLHSIPLDTLIMVYTKDQVRGGTTAPVFSIGRDRKNMVLLKGSLPSIGAGTGIISPAESVI